eukprot:685361-Pyramimonas_sp.AAC.1
MARALREEALHLLISQMRPVRELSASPICFCRARGTPERPGTLVIRFAVAAFHWPMALARVIIFPNLRCCQMRRVR